MSSKGMMLSLAASALFVAIGPGTQTLAQSRSPIYPNQGVVYVETNNPAAGQNAVLAFQRASNGLLTPLNGSPYLTGGAGVRDLSDSLATFANDTPVIANKEHTLLFAVNEGSNSVAVFAIGPQGELKAVQGSPFSSGGFQPVSLSLVGNILTVVNKNGDPAQAAAEANAQPNYTNFRVDDGGSLTPTGSTVIATASPSQALAVPQDRYFSLAGNNGGQAGGDFGFVFGADFGGGKLQSFEVGHNGILSQNPPQALPASLFAGQTFLGGPAPALPLGLQVHPQYPILYVGLVTINKIGVYSFNSEGKLNFVGAVVNPAVTNCWLLINKAGTRMYAVDTITNQVTTFDIGTNPLAPQALGVTQLQGNGRAFELALSGDDQFLYVISQQGVATGSLNDNQLHVLSVGDNGNTLNEIETEQLPNFVSNLPAFTRWQGVVAF